MIPVKQVYRDYEVVGVVPAHTGFSRVLHAIVAELHAIRSTRFSLSFRRPKDTGKRRPRAAKKRIPGPP